LINELSFFCMFSYADLFSSIVCSRTEPNNCKRLFSLSATTIVPSVVISKPHGRLN